VITTEWLYHVASIGGALAVILSTGLAFWQRASVRRLDNAETAITAALQRAEDAARLADSASNTAVSASAVAAQARETAAATELAARGMSNDLSRVSEGVAFAKSELNALEFKQTTLSRAISDQDAHIKATEKKLSHLDELVEELSAQSEAARRRYEAARAKAAEIDRETQRVVNEPFAKSMIRILIVSERTFDEKAQTLRERLSAQGYQVQTVSVDTWDADARSRRRMANMDVSPRIPPRAVIAGEQAAPRVEEVLGILRSTMGSERWTVKTPQGQEATYYDIRPDLLLIMIR
jgi:hypothetical protein